MTTIDINIIDIPSREQIYRLEEEIRKLPQVDCPIRHFFTPGMYAREMTIRAGTVLTGAVHKTEHLNIISAGRIQVWTESGMKEIAAPFTFISMPGTKRAGYAMEDTVWTTLHATKTTDIDELVSELTESEAKDLLGYEAVPIVIGDKS